ncbi:hypothetical protein SMALB_1585 [Streptomyces malaysiensis]|uniref:Uncharacterized protein n=1 Tax=Streptomyces malaysiensis TaxID=92644 RepID=A0A7X5WZ31_STRMQ|nr:hypothetical protein [Streptomyces malaysiensis]
MFDVPHTDVHQGVGGTGDGEDGLRLGHRVGGTDAARREPVQPSGQRRQIFEGTNQIQRLIISRQLAH